MDYWHATMSYKCTQIITLSTQAFTHPWRVVEQSPWWHNEIWEMVKQLKTPKNSRTWNRREVRVLWRDWVGNLHQWLLLNGRLDIAAHDMTNSGRNLKITKNKVPQTNHIRGSFTHQHDCTHIHINVCIVKHTNHWSCHCTWQIPFPAILPISLGVISFTVLSYPNCKKHNKVKIHTGSVYSIPPCAIDTV